MRTMKTSELIDQTLDWAVAKANGRCTDIEECDGVSSWVSEGNSDYEYSTRWSAGGPIIEREGILLRPVRKDGHPLNGQWLAMYDRGNTGSMVQWSDKFWFPRHYLKGPTPLVAAMRCYVASKLGDEVEIPNELIVEK